jgi:hypothetical protein
MPGPTERITTTCAARTSGIATAGRRRVGLPSVALPSIAPPSRASGTRTARNSSAGRRESPALTAPGAVVAMAGSAPRPARTPPRPELEAAGATPTPREHRDVAGASPRLVCLATRSCFPRHRTDESRPPTRALHSVSIYVFRTNGLFVPGSLALQLARTLQLSSQQLDPARVWAHRMHPAARGGTSWTVTSLMH